MVSSLLARCIIVTIGTLYPGYRSYKSLINSDLREVVNCLRYWIVFSLFIACETVTDILLSWFPFYYWIKIFFVLWMISPAGASVLYKRLVQPVLKEREQDIDQLLEQTKQKGYSTLLDLTNKGFRYASNVFLNTAVYGQAYLGEHLKRSLSTSDIGNDPVKGFSNVPDTLYEEDEEADPQFSKRLKEDRKFLSKGTNDANRQTRSQQREKPDIIGEDSTSEIGLTKATTNRKPVTRTGNKVTCTVSSSNVSTANGTTTKRKVTKKAMIQYTAPVTPVATSSTDTDDDDDDDDDVNNNDNGKVQKRT